VAHSCPDCGQACYCGGDIDDIFLEDEDSLDEAELMCTHCEGIQDEEARDEAA